MEKILRIFKENAKYDEFDERDFEKDFFISLLSSRFEDKDIDSLSTDEICYIVTICLNYVQYGDISDTDDLSDMYNDLKNRDLFHRVTYV